MDGDPCNLRNDGSYDLTDGDWNHSFMQSQNFYRLYKEFKNQNPDAGLDGCSSGGHTITIESVRYTDQQQVTDGMCKHIGGYWTTMLMPIDKHQGMPISGTGRRSFTDYDESGRDLFSSPGMGNQNPLDPYTVEALEGYRKEHELFYWLRAQGVYGRWIQVFRPTLEHCDPTYVMQRMNRELTKGLIMISGWDTNAMIGKSERIYPKGLHPEYEYYIESLRGSMPPQKKTGSQWMIEGILLDNIKKGEYLFINLPDRPGQGGLGAKIPDRPATVEKRQETWLRRDGISVSWSPVIDNGRIIHYEIEKNGSVYTKIASGNYFFDEKGKPGDAYSIRAVDSDGRASESIII